ncbi:isoprenyl transferase [candidate division KSB1 bacterium]|nr:isoprenyl transferase [candidate division KSB1 bacterium]
MRAQGPVPRHVAIIMDGNGRWANVRNLSRIEGHRVGIESVRSALQVAGRLGIKTLTLYTFSKENWRRPQTEVSALMSLLLKTIKDELNELDKNNVRLGIIGNIDDLPLAPRMGIRSSLNHLSKNTGLLVNLALSYSGRLEIVQAVRALAQKAKAGEIDPAEIDEAMIAQYLQTRDVGDPDLLIRTSGEMRVSNFLLWQIAYTEIYVTPVLWPDFRENEFLAAIENYQCRERRYGRVSNQTAKSI